MIGKAEISQAIQELSLAGKALCIHASMRSFGDQVEDGAHGLLEAFRQADCTVMTPAFSYGFLANPVERYMPTRNGAGDYVWYREHPLEPGIFSAGCKELSVEDMGMFARQVLMHPKSVRGNHPLNSFAAVGEYAHALINGQNWRHVYAPFERLCETDGLVLMLGTDLKSATILHYAESLAGRELFIRWAKDGDGQTRPACTGGCSNGFEQFSPYLAGIERRATVGRSMWRLYPAKEMVRIAADAIRRDPLITHCKSESCKRCRDAVRGGPVLDADFWTK